MVGDTFSGVYIMGLGAQMQCPMSRTIRSYFYKLVKLISSYFFKNYFWLVDLFWIFFQSQNIFYIELYIQPFSPPILSSLPLLLPRYNLNYTAEVAREKAAQQADHEKMMKRFKPVRRVERRQASWGWRGDMAPVGRGDAELLRMQRRQGSCRYWPGAREGARSCSRTWDRGSSSRSSNNNFVSNRGANWLKQIYNLNLKF